MKRVYVCAPLGGDVEGNLKRVRAYTEYALRCGTAPVVPHFYGMTGMPFVCGESPQGAQLPANPIATCKVRIVRCGREEAIAKS